ncbi:response regulator transcription factor [Nocardioides sp. URHA0032]|uniref:response regulator transcription factor n=1 Tax=Nocardioides sp. URHA0032 TaxID=1380388 RepID=UPI00048EE087|nr:response regulator transcription factor [Nocardioides sp. URHA0032]
MTDHEARPIRVALSNDYEIALLGIAQMLARHPSQVQVVDLTTNTEMQHRPDVILFDTFGRLPDDDRKLRAVIDQNPAKVVVYSWDDYPEEAARRAGAAGYVSKRLSANELVAAIAAIHDRTTVEAVEPDGEPVITWPGQAIGLSQRESEMLGFITRGLTNAEIARRAYLSINTVKTYIRTAYAKIGVRNRAEAVAWGIRNGFESTDDTGI